MGRAGDGLLGISSHGGDDVGLEGTRGWHEGSKAEKKGRERHWNKGQIGGAKDGGWLTYRWFQGGSGMLRTSGPRRWAEAWAGTAQGLSVSGCLGVGDVCTQAWTGQGGGKDGSLVGGWLVASSLVTSWARAVGLAQQWWQGIGEARRWQAEWQKIRVRR
ncbi:hypothetical protein E2562_024735 [Oryza meyeriana var. granulata]|uniref:Uncharacterized protein n=1 Tax=Oryza meyeriana var. granulata TaxID=110450 RepID=A0A6G1D7C6_9ORYZ|nr:hypothetical protein E2562_024735 [Oryza meyeriana var. granulata]